MPPQLHFVALLKYKGRFEPIHIYIVYFPERMFQALLYNIDSRRPAGDFCVQIVLTTCVKIFIFVLMILYFIPRPARVFEYSDCTPMFTHSLKSLKT